MPNRSKAELSPSDMRKLLEQDREMLRIVTEERLREMAAFVEPYEAGTLSWGQVHRKWTAYIDRWDVALTTDHSLNERIERMAIDHAFGPRDWEAWDKKTKLAERHLKRMAKSAERPAETER